MRRALYTELAMAAQAYHALSMDAEQRRRLTLRIMTLVQGHLPQYPGENLTTCMDIERSTGDELWFITQYAGEVQPKVLVNRDVAVRPSLTCGITMHVRGRDTRGCKDEIADEFYNTLTLEGELK